MLGCYVCQTELFLGNFAQIMLNFIYFRPSRLKIWITKISTPREQEWDGNSVGFEDFQKVLQSTTISHVKAI